MTKKSVHKKSIDLGALLESTLLGVFILIGRHVNTLYLFARKPDTFVGALDEIGRANTVTGSTIVRPLTFLTISMGVLMAANLAVIRARGNSAEIRTYEGGEGFNAIYPLFINALTTFDIQNLVMAVSPWVLIVGLFSYTVSRSAQRNGFNFSFVRSIGLSSYFCGAAACALLIPAPLVVYLYLYTDLRVNTQFRLWADLSWLVLFVLFCLRFFYSYLSVLGAEIKTNIKRCFQIWVGGLWRFTLAFIVISAFIGNLLTPLLKTAAGTLRPQAEQGSAEAQYKLGVAYDNGTGVPQDDREAITWYRKAAEQGYAKAQNNLGAMYANGQGVTQNYQDAATWYRKAGVQGYAIAQYNLGALYADGRGVPQNYQEAAKWYRKAADQGSAKAQNSLGVAYYKGNGVPRHYQEAEKWFRKAAENGQAYAQNNLGVTHYKGHGVPRNYQEAAKWFRKAAEQGHVNAQANLGIAYYNGQGVPQNNVLAYMLLSLGAPSGDEEAARLHEILEKKMTSSDIAKGQALAAQWKSGAPLPVH